MTAMASELLTGIKAYLPEWPIGFASRGIMLRHLKKLLPHCYNKLILDMAINIAKWRWQLYPWDRETINILSALSVKSGTSLLTNWAQPLSSQLEHNFFLAIQAIVSGKAEDVITLWKKFGSDTLEAAWVGETCLFFLQRGDADTVRMILKSTSLPVHHPVKAHLEALFAFVFEEQETALRTIRCMPDDFRWLRMLLEAQYLIQSKDTTGIYLLQQLWNEIPWFPNLTLTLHTLLSPGFIPTLAGQDTAVLIYSWNNAELLKNTLECIARSELGEASVVLLDNGSTDHTKAVFASFSELFGLRLKSMQLPVNIGAPAARNWLLRHTDLQPFQTIVYLDDDVIVPPDWLTKLTSQYRQLPAGSILGCRIMNQSPQQSLQMADVNLLDLEQDSDFLIANSGGGELDLGLHSYSRPCLSVTGCCHMMDRRHAVDLGGFDLRFSPSQFDDFDLDLRNALQGGRAVYAGRTAIRHCQRSSLNQADSEAKQGHIQGNMLKLRTKYTRSQKVDLLHRNRDILWNDLISKTRDLEQA